MTDYGIFLCCNRYDGLFVRHIVAGLSPEMKITDVPDTVDEDELIRKVEPLGFDCILQNYEHYSSVILPRDEWPTDDCKFGMVMSYGVL